ncbi:MAG: hypothetical protein ACRERR_07385 [Moraxellaceae bacterium]
MKIPKHFMTAALLLSLFSPLHAESPNTNTPSSTGASPSTPIAPAATGTDISSPPADAATVAAPGPRIYLVTRIKLSGTDLTQVVFFQHPAMNTMEACEAERAGGLMNNWTYFGRYYLKTLKGVSYKVDYRCVESDIRLAYWRQGTPNNISYLVRTTDNKLQASSHENFFDCRHALRVVAKEESVDNFCGVSSQAILKELPPEAAPTTTAP